MKHDGTPIEVLVPQQESPRQMQLALHNKVIIVTNVKEKQIRPLWDVLIARRKDT